MDSRLKKFFQNLTIFLVTSLISFFLLEVMIRLILHTTVDGQDTFMRARLHPYVLPVLHTQERVDTYFETDKLLFNYNELLGWELKSSRGKTNEQGLRGEVTYELAPKDDVLRIALFGDSFTYGAEVEWEDSWGYLLENMLNAQGLDVEVLNFGVSAYGIDQAFLRYQVFGKDWKPDIVIHGFVYEDVYRNLNIFPQLYVSESGLPFSKPRYVLEDEALRLVNDPVMPLEDVPEAIRTLPDSELAPYEYFYNAEDYEVRWWQSSRLLALTEASLSRLSIDTSGTQFPLVVDDSVNLYPASFYEVESEASQLTLAIWRDWQEVVQADCGVFMIVHLPRQEDLERFRAGQRIIYADFLEEAQSRFYMIETMPSFSEDVPSNYAKDGHYSPQGTPHVARTLADEIAACEECDIAQLRACRDN